MKYDWLLQELDAIKTKRFHLIHASELPTSARHPLPVGVRLPNSFVDFIGQFGNTFLFRDGESYLIFVSARPWEMKTTDGEVFVCFGHYDDRSACFSLESLNATGDSDVFESRCADTMRMAASDFDCWFRSRYELARKQFSAGEWRRILRGPREFSRLECAIVEARKLIRWKFLGLDSSGLYQFEVWNGSDLQLAYLSLGVRATDNSFSGGIWLPIHSISPGNRGIAAHRAYSDTGLSKDVEFYDLPDPAPEDRDRYWEFKALKRH